MPFLIDPELSSALSAMAAVGTFVEAAPGDLPGLRAALESASLISGFPIHDDVEVTPYTLDIGDGATIALSWYRKRGAGGGPAVVYAHGGGMIFGTAALYDPLVRLYASLTSASFLNVDYRLAPEHSDTGLALDVLAALKWLLREASSLGVDPGRIAVMGDSGGGGVAAATAILAREQAIALCRQILIYPMLDDRNIEPDPFLAPAATWSYENNGTAWAAVTGGAANAVPPSLAPARLADFSGLAPAYIEVGEMDIFRDESIEYAFALLKAGVSCELHVHPGALHGHDMINPEAKLSARVIADRVRVISGV